MWSSKRTCWRKSIKYMEVCGCLCNGTGGKSFSELPIKPEIVCFDKEDVGSRKWMPLPMLYQTAVNRQLSRIALYRRLMVNCYCGRDF